MSEEIQKTIAETVKERFDSLSFTKTAGYTQYAPKDSAEREARSASIEHFLEDDTVIEPESAPTRYSQSDIEKTAEQYDMLLAVLFSQPERSEEDEILIDKIINKTGELFRYEELMLSVGAASLGDVDRHRRIAADLSIEIMGGVNKGAFNELVGELWTMAESSDAPYAQELKELLPRPPEGPEATENATELSEKTRELIGSDLFSLYPELRTLLQTENTGSLSASEAVPIFKEAERIAALEDWSVEVDDGASAHTSSNEKTVYIGKDRVFKDQRSTVAVALHEAIVHGGRSEGVSFPGCLDFEEGLATRLQQVITGETRAPGAQYYLSIGLQAGADRGGEPRNYRETFEIMWRREALLMEKAGNSVDVQKARATAQRQVQRTRRGGAIDTRDSAYFVGAQKAAVWLNEIASLPPAERRRILATTLTNRIDPTIPEQLAYAEAHG